MSLAKKTKTGAGGPISTTHTTDFSLSLAACWLNRRAEAIKTWLARTAL